MKLYVFGVSQIAWGTVEICAETEEEARAKIYSKDWESIEIAPGPYINIDLELVEEQDDLEEEHDNPCEEHAFTLPNGETLDCACFRFPQPSS